MENNPNQNNRPNEYPLASMPVTHQPQSHPQQFIQAPPPQYQYHQGQPHQIQQQIQVVSLVEADLVSGILQNINEYRIFKSSKTTRYAADRNNAQLFAYSEEVIANSAYVRAAGLFFNDNQGRRFLQAEIDLSGTKVFTGNRQLGVIEVPNCCSSFQGSSVLGLGQVEFQGKGCSSCALTCCICLNCLCGSGAKFDIMIGYKKSGEFAMEGDSATTKFNEGLDPRVKAIAVVMSFMAFNQMS